MNSIVAGHYPVRESGGMVWVYLVSVVVLLGAEVMAVMEAHG